MKLTFIIIAAIVVIGFLASIADGFLTFTASIKNSIFIYPLMVIGTIIFFYNEHKKEKNKDNQEKKNRINIRTKLLRNLLIYNGKEYFLATDPLSAYLKSKNIRFIYSSDVCDGNWVIEDNKLYLTGVEAMLPNYKKIGLDYLFPGQTKVFAEWYSGEIRISIFTVSQYMHIEYESLVSLKLEKGVIIDKCIIKKSEAQQKSRLLSFDSHQAVLPKKK